MATREELNTALDELIKSIAALQEAIGEGPDFATEIASVNDAVEKINAVTGTVGS